MRASAGVRLLTLTMAGEKGITMNKLKAEWIPYMKAYRLYDACCPQQTIAYEEDETVAEQRALEAGYSGLVICDADTMHIECFD